MKPPASIAWGIVFSVSVAGCALPPTAASDMDDASRARPITAERATNAVAIGRSTAAEVRAALGETTVVRFDSGYEVWVYPIADDAPERPRSTRARSEMERRAAHGEFVVLFAPTGQAVKARLRSATPAVQQ